MRLQRLSGTLNIITANTVTSPPLQPQTHGDIRVMRLWHSSFFTSGDHIYASEIIKVVFICKDYVAEQNF